LFLCDLKNALVARSAARPTDLTLADKLAAAVPDRIGHQADRWMTSSGASLTMSCPEGSAIIWHARVERAI
jgi:hypothetical protein